MLPSECPYGKVCVVSLKNNSDAFQETYEKLFDKFDVTH